MASGKQSIAYSVVLISILGLISKVIGLLREGVYSFYLGTSQTADDFFLIYGFLTNVTALLGMSIGIAYLPVFVKDSEKLGDKMALRNCACLMNRLFLVMLLLTAFLFFFPHFWASIIAPAYDFDRQLIISRYIRYFSLIVFMAVAVHIYASVFDAQKRFGISRVIGMSYSVLSILFLILFYNSWGFDALVYAVMVSFLLQYAVSVFFLYKNVGYHWGLVPDSWRMQDLYKQIVPVFIGTGTLYIGQLIDRTVASTLAIGSVAALNYSGTLHSLINTLLIVSIVTVFYREFVGKFVKGQVVQMLHTLSRGIVVLVLLLVPISIYSILNAEDIIEFLLQRGAFTRESVKITALAFAFYLIGTPFYGVRNLLTRAFYAMNDTRTPLLNGVGTIVLNVVLCLGFVYVFSMGIKGITLASSLTAIVSSFLLLFSLHHKGFRLDYGILVRESCKILIAAMITVIVLLCLGKALVDFSLVWRLMFSLLVLVGCYFVSLLLLANREALYVYQRIKQFIVK